MNVELFSYELPGELIAQHPPDERDGGRLLRLGRRDGGLAHARIRDLPELLPAEALLVVNDTRVFPARLWARRPSGGRVELLLLERLEAAAGEEPAAPAHRWSCMVRASKRPRAGERLLIEGAGEGAAVELTTPVEQGRATVLVADEVIERHGAVPLPPYIDRPDRPEDRQRYQTVYAEPPGSVAAPTAGLHFTEALLERIRGRGVAVAAVTLHVGPGTFQPVRAERVEDHRMEHERYIVPGQTADAIRAARREGRPVIAVGTTVVRTLESTGGEAGEGRTDLFITPGHTFRAVDGLLTNFHLPRSTLLMLVSAFAGRERVLAAYAEAVALRYRFYSYGDAMLIL